MKVFIFGAGASHGSIPESQYNSLRLSYLELIPPLTDELFHGKYFKHTHQFVEITDFEKNNISEGIKENNGSLEQYLTARWKKSQKLKNQNLKEAELGFFGSVAYYLSALFVGVSDAFNPNTNLYSKLAAKLRNNGNDFAILTFNYDLLLDKALSIVFNKTFSSLDEYINFNYFKLHGSANWFIRYRGNNEMLSPSDRQDMQYVIRRASNLIYSDNLDIENGRNITVIDPRHENIKTYINLMESHDNQIFYPLIFMPLAVKMYDSVYGFERTVIEKSKEQLRQATSVDIVGYKASDAIFKELIRQVPSHVPVNVHFRTEESGISLKSQIDYIRQNSYCYAKSGGFAGFVESI